MISLVPWVQWSMIVFLMSIDFTNCYFLPFLGKGQCNQEKAIADCTHVDVAIKSYVISILTGSTFDGFIDCTHIGMVKDFNKDLDIHQILFNRCCILFCGVHRGSQLIQSTVSLSKICINSELAPY